MNSIMLWNGMKRNISLLLLLTAGICLTATLKEFVHGATWSLLAPVTIAATLSGWGVAKSRLNGVQAAGGMAALGIPALFFFISGLVDPIKNLVVSTVSIFHQMIHWLYDKTPVNIELLAANWLDLTRRTSAILTRLMEWIGMLMGGKTATDPIIALLVWSILLWFIGTWSGWQLHRHKKALRALTPGGLVFALILKYTGMEIELLILYLGILLAMMGLSQYEELRESWQRRGLDYSDSIAIDLTMSIIPLSLLIVGLASITPSFSWQDFVEKLRESTQGGSDHVAESLGLDASANVALSETYLSSGLPRNHLVGMPPEELQTLVMTVSTGELPPMPNINVAVNTSRYYWRALTYDIYSGAGWASSQAQNISLPADTPLMELPSSYHVINQHVRLASDQVERVYWSGTLVQADVDIDIAWRTLPPQNTSPTHNGDMLGVLTGINEYKVISVIPQLSVMQLRSAGSNYPPEIIQRYLYLPESVPERVRALARELTGNAPTPYDRALAIETYLRTFPYTLDVEPPPRGQDITDHFLFTSQKGYCDYHASAMVVLARAAGLPARIVVGYTSGTYNLATAQYEIRQENAHSWPEIYFPGIGWVEFEPTASLPRISHPDDENTSQPDLHPAPDHSAPGWLKANWKSIISDTTNCILLMAAGLAALIAVWQVGEITYLYFISSPRAIHTIYALLQKYAANLLPRVPCGYTPRELQLALAEKLEQINHYLFRPMLKPASMEIKQIASLYEALEFSQHRPIRQQVLNGIKAWGRLRWRLRLTNWGNWISQLIHKKS
jgi:transglutaminase-like putative cysteine protease